MPVLPVFDIEKKKVGDVNLDDRVFNVPLKKHLVYEAVVAHNRNLRQGNASTKTRGEVRGGGKKPFRQKGTGRARQGSSRDAHQVGGGVALGPRPRSYGYDLSKKSRQAALRTVLSQQCRDKLVVVLKDLKLEKMKTKTLFLILEKFDLKKGLIVDLSNTTLQKSSENLHSFKFVTPDCCHVTDLLKYQSLVITESAILNIEKRLQPL